MTPSSGNNGGRGEHGTGDLGPGTMYRVEWILGDVPMNPFEYARLLWRAWMRQPITGLSLRVHATATGQVKISIVVEARSATAAMGRWTGRILSAVRERGLEYPGYVLAWAGPSDP